MKNEYQRLIIIDNPRDEKILTFINDEIIESEYNSLQPEDDFIIEKIVGLFSKKNAIIIQESFVAELDNNSIINILKDKCYEEDIYFSYNICNY